jgi:hypothetical protein
MDMILKQKELDNKFKEIHSNIDTSYFIFECVQFDKYEINEPKN